MATNGTNGSNGTSPPQVERKMSSQGTPNCLVFMRMPFGSTPQEQQENATKWIVNKLGADYVISTRIYFHGHFSSPEKMQSASLKSKKDTGPLQPPGATCMQKNCGVQKHSVEARIKKAGLDYSSVRRWILANKRVVFTEEVFRDARKESKEGGEKERQASMDEVKEAIMKTQQKLGYEPPTPQEQSQSIHSVESRGSGSITMPSSANGNSGILRPPPPVTAAAHPHVNVPSSTPEPSAPIKTPSQTEKARQESFSSNSQSSAAASSGPLPPPPKKSGLKVYVKSRQGQSWDPNKVNQDRPLACVPLRGHPGVHLYGVMDGHGSNGQHVSEFCMHQLPAFLAAEKNLRADVPGCMTSAVANMCQALQESNINLAFSGTTCVFGIHIDKQMWIGNIGDSRCVLLREGPDKSPVIIPLSIDHKPDSPGEMERILAAGGRVCPIPGMDSGPNRVWLAELDEPGLAMARSVGDEVSQTVGVISVPELIHHQLEDTDKMCIFASDGIWEFLPNESVAEILWKNQNDPAVAVNTLVAEAVRRWQEDSEQVIDDITVVLVVFK